MTPATGTGVGIPRLQELDFLDTAMQCVVEGARYDEIRLSLIDHMMYVRRGQELTGNHAGRRPAATKDPARYFHNTNECLTELMRLHWVERAALPSEKKSVDLYRDARFAPTPRGAAWVARLGEDRAGALDELLRGLWGIHPQLASYITVLGAGDFRVPLAGWDEVLDSRSLAEDEETRAAARRTYSRILVGRCAKAVDSGVTGWQAPSEEIDDALVAYIEKLTARAAKRSKEPFPRNRDFVQACEEALVSFALGRAGAQMDFITFEILRRWLRSLNVASFSYHAPGPTALTCWATAEVRAEQPSALTVSRRTGPEWEQRVRDELPAAVARVGEQDRGAFVPIYKVRAATCSRLGISELVFERAVRRLLTERDPDAPYGVHLDSAGGGSPPPTERPFLFEVRGRQRPFHLMSLISRKDQT